jgi:hypothetical protein
LQSSWHLSCGVLLHERLDSHTCSASGTLHAAHCKRARACVASSAHTPDRVAQRSLRPRAHHAHCPPPLPPRPPAAAPRHSMTYLDRRSPGHPATPPWLRRTKPRAVQSVLTCNARTHGCTAGCSKTAARVGGCYRQNSPCQLRGLLQRLGSPRPLRVHTASACHLTCALVCVSVRSARVRGWCGVSVRQCWWTRHVCVCLSLNPPKP